MQRLYFLTAVITLSFIVTISTHEPAHGFTEGKTIRIYLGVSPGGGHDTEARLIAYRRGETDAVPISDVFGKYAQE